MARTCAIAPNDARSADTQSGLAAAGVHFGAVRLGIFYPCGGADADLVLVTTPDGVRHFRTDRRRPTLALNDNQPPLR